MSVIVCAETMLYAQGGTKVDMDVFESKQQCRDLVRKVEELNRKWSKWHPGLNQLQKFKPLDFPIPKPNY